MISIRAKGCRFRDEGMEFGVCGRLCTRRILPIIAFFQERNILPAACLSCPDCWTNKSRSGLTEVRSAPALPLTESAQGRDFPSSDASSVSASSPIVVSGEACRYQLPPRVRWAPRMAIVGRKETLTRRPLLNLSLTLICSPVTARRVAMLRT